MVEKDKQNQKQMCGSRLKKCPMWLNSNNSAKGKKTKIPTQHHQRLTASYCKYLAAVLAAKDGTIINC